ncbi:MAG: hypothetical protein ACE5EO_07615 [Candidatus Krumholzibacteriia bacterium]
MFKRILLGVVLLSFAGTGCAMYVRPAPPPPRVDVRTARPHKHAVWVPGHWKWTNRKRGYAWVPGHWRRAR